MPEFITTLFGANGFEPHNTHFQDVPELIWLNVAANALIALAYLSIPVALWYFVRKRKDLEYRRIFTSFGIFIMSCGISHLMHILVYWYPAYWLELAVNAVTAISSIAVAIALWYLIPFALKIPRPSELAAAELEIRKKEEELILQKAMEVRRNEFISAASHELKTPLTSQRILIETLGQSFQRRGDSEHEKYLSKILSQTHRLSQLVENLLDVARIEGEKIVFAYHAFDLAALVRDVVDDLQTVTPSHTFVVEGAVGRHVTADRERISQVLVNLLTNAVKYSPKANKVVIGLTGREDEVEVSVTDFGIGIDAAHHERLFERFYRVEGENERTYPGMGIGLFISSEIIRHHGGRIWVESSKGGGSTFRFTVPYERKVLEFAPENGSVRIKEEG